MRDDAFVWAALAALAAAGVLRFRSMFRRRRLAPGERRHAWTSLAMFLGIAGVYAGTMAEGAAAGRLPAWPLMAAGAAVYAAGLWLRLAAIRTLGAYFSPYIEMRDRQPLIQAGPFRYMRHPNYAGLLLEAIGLPLAFQATAVLLFVAAVFLPVLVIRIRLEEKALILKFGDAYLAYRRSVWALAPVRRLMAEQNLKACAEQVLNPKLQALNSK